MNDLIITVIYQKPFTWDQVGEISPSDDGGIIRTTGTIQSLDFKKGTMRVSYKNEKNKRVVKEFPISGFFHNYEINKI